ncbi:MAG TPA: DUF4962 domain-containing protein [Candidatus Hydrogenedentes bacterium]|nr:DUF4962 domain-containing protein [Candidatus Hydrogenedentota bacterium]
MRRIVMSRFSIVALCFLLAAMGVGAIELDQSPAVTGEWGYRPAPEATPAVNPPGFTWRPCPDAAAYHLQVAADETFETIAYEKRDISWSAHCPPVTFAPGGYYWRYAALGKEGQRTEWSTARAFTVGAEAVAFPLPPTTELIERMPADHPRLFFRSEDLPRLRELARGPLEAPYDALVKSADALMANPPDTSEPPLYPEGTKRLSNEWKKIWWGNRVRTQKLTDGAATLAFVYRLTGDERYGRAARELLLAFAQWDPKGSTNYRYNDEAAMPGLYYPSRAYSWVYPLLSEADRASIASVMRIRGQDCFDSLQRSPHLWRPYNSHHNRAWHWLGEVAIAFHGEFPEADPWLEYAMTILCTTYPVWNDADGGWHEGLAYWSSYLGRFAYWADVVNAAFGIDVYDLPFFSNVGNYGLYLMPPGTAHGGFGDQTTTMKSSNIADLMAVFAAGANNPYWQWYADVHHADVGGGYAGFLRRARAVKLEAKPPADLPGSIQFRKTGLAVLNTNLLDGTHNVQLHFKSSPFFGRQSHGYNANNAFLLNLDGQPVFVRSGRRDVYGSPHHKDWMWHSRSDNAILVNGESQIKHSAEARGELIAFYTSPALDVVAGEASASYENLDLWKRRIVFFKPHGFLIHDVLSAPEPSRFQWMLHTKGAMTIEGNRVSWEGAPGRVDVDFAYPADLAITQTGQYEPPPAEWTGWDLGEWHLTAEPRDSAAQQEFVTFVAVQGAHAAIDAAQSALPRKVTVSLPEGSAAVTFEEAAMTVALPGAAPQTFTETR